MRPPGAWVVLALCMSAQAQESWDLTHCQESLRGNAALEKAGHVCTPEHLEADLAQLIKERKDAATIDATTRRALRFLAEDGIVDLGAAAKRAESDAAQSQAVASMWSRFVQLLARPGAQNFNGSALLDWCEDSEKKDRGVAASLCIGYVSGVADSLALHGLGEWAERQATRHPELVAPPEKRRPIFCSPDGGSYGQYVKVVLKFLRDHPERLHEDRRNLVEEALQDAFPCPVK